ncbi:hypothetical protein B0H13DRAFT_589529 [Mycena leptocephala]|nr:hypothetical protein B0H13DRAFT_589529 [Mycena leptocephala]
MLSSRVARPPSAGGYIVWPFPCSMRVKRTSTRRPFAVPHRATSRQSLAASLFSSPRSRTLTIAPTDGVLDVARRGQTILWVLSHPRDSPDPPARRPPRILPRHERPPRNTVSLEASACRIPPTQRAPPATCTTAAGAVFRALISLDYLRLAQYSRSRLLSPTPRSSPPRHPAPARLDGVRKTQGSAGVRLYPCALDLRLQSRTAPLQIPLAACPRRPPSSRAITCIPLQISMRFLTYLPSFIYLYLRLNLSLCIHIHS